MYLMAVE